MLFILLPGLVLSLEAYCQTEISRFPTNKVLPSEQQVSYQEMEVIGFLHFNMNTFTGKEWGNGDEDPALFNPTALDAEQWVKVARDAGMKELILTAKHHDGFCLWPSRYTEHSIKNSPYKNGKGDIVKEFTDACRKYGLKAGIYLSPWDRNNSEYGKPGYISYYRNQLTELLTNYGTISEIWFDGANGGTGYYGGANEERRIDAKTYYGWDSTIKLVKNLQPGILVFSDAGPDIHWIGNENGSVGETFWSTINNDHLVIGASDMAYLNSGDQAGNKWICGECDVSIRPGWFYHPEEDSLVKTPENLADLYYKSVGRNAVLLLNVPPDKQGLIADNDIKALQKFRSILNETFKTNFASGRQAQASSTWNDDKQYSASNILDNNINTFWAAGKNADSVEISIDLGKPVIFDRILISEPVPYGQRIAEFRIEAEINGKWTELCRGTTIGFKRLLRINPVNAGKVKIIIKKANNIPALSEFGLFKASVYEKPVER
ncbi:MAG: alpha-L-fucosidase [Bacteroidia bacterium]|nr:alpha-L-fucosidase [Bacteroidia bacterium]